jgi:glycosyltransferase involved in cell wall biosynthesis
VLIHPDAERPAIEDIADPQIAAFVASILEPAFTAGPAPQPASAQQDPPALLEGPTSAYRPRDSAPMNFILYSATTEASLAKDIGGPEYSYYFVARTFKPLLSLMGTIHTASDPVDDVDRIYSNCLERGENCLLLYCAPPHRIVLGTRCPFMPVIAWEYPDIATEVWNDDVRNDWRTVLRQSAGAITLSELAAAAIRKAMGDRFPVLAVPSPVWDRSPTPRVKLPLRPPEETLGLEFDGLVFDSRGRVFKMNEPPPQPQSAARIANEKAELTLDGVVLTSVFAPKDGRKNWHEILTAFLSAFKDTPDATLVLKMIGHISHWWWELNDWLTRVPPFRCRIVALHGYLSDVAYTQLIGATHWIVNGSNAEGLCLPLLEYMCAGRPAIAPTHTAMADYIRDTNALTVRSEEECAMWPQDARRRFTTVRHAIDWTSLRDAMREAYRITKSDPGRYAALSDGATATMQGFCSDAVIRDKLTNFLSPRARTPAAPSTSASV